MTLSIVPRGLYFCTIDSSPTYLHIFLYTGMLSMMFYLTLKLAVIYYIKDLHFLSPLYLVLPPGIIYLLSFMKESENRNNIQFNNDE